LEGYMDTRKCVKCGAEISEEDKFCTNCGSQIVDSVPVHTDEPNRGKWALARMIIGILSMVLFIVIALQSCAAGASNILSNSGEISGTAGLLTAICFFVGGLVGLLTRNSKSKGGAITSCIFFWAAYFFSRMFAGSYGDLKIWGILAFIFGTVYLLSAMTTKKSTIIASVIAAVYLVLGLI